ncbi:hypothetical protein H6G89_30400 [Oscillatoria sp. FACHB-1407]|uniref:hypothetical protein n=1 Tax=Oscillatoria sp. FACHB-1407 TaxID=2692847 RepID=UPI001688E17F|nr:hypothetical protein [Oscillatoria sp. FACHB-1407]MBD2465325.1 hypothetical protein [Oscillatoria sp. FACHB-1407]
MAKSETKSKQSVEDKEKQHETTNKNSKPAHKEDKNKSAKAENHHEEEQPKSKPAKAEGHAETHNDIDEGEELNALLETFDGNDLTAIAIDQATGFIDEWYDILHKSKEPELKEIGNSLKQLKKWLTGNKTKGEDLVEVLNQLGEQTDNFANNAERGHKTQLHKLGKVLNRASSFIEKELKKDEKNKDK